MFPNSIPVSIVLVALPLLALLGLLRFFFIVIVVNGSSMEPTFIANDKLLVIRNWPTKYLRVGQIIAFTPPIDVYKREANQLLKRPIVIKRVIGLPGDEIILPVTELEYFPIIASGNYPKDEKIKTWHVSKDHLFVKGDSWGLDSRVWGPIPSNHVIGLVIAKISRNAN